MSSKEYDTLEPIPSQAERDLSFLDASVEVTDFSNSKSIRITKKLRKRPWFGYKMNPLGRTMQALVILAVSLMGFVSGLLLLGIPLKASNVYLLFRYGYTGENKGLQIIQYDGAITEGPNHQYYFKISGEIYNFDKQFLPEKNFIVNIFSQDNKLLDQRQFTCCSKEFYPGKITKIEESIPVSTNEISSYQLKFF
jgi:hypothetical protein